MAKVTLPLETEICKKSECRLFNGFEFDENGRITGAQWLVGTPAEIYRIVERRKPEHLRDETVTIEDQSVQ